MPRFKSYLKLGRLLLTTSLQGWRMRQSAPGAGISEWSKSLLDQLQIQVHVESPLQHCPKGTLWVSNHVSWLDPLALLSLRPASILAKAEVAQYPWIGKSARRAGLCFVCREDPMSRAASTLSLMRHFKAGHNFLLFPEGTTTQGKRLAPLYEGGLKLAYRMKVPVLPFSLYSPDAHYAWTGDEALLPHLKTLLQKGKTRLHIKAGNLLNPLDFPREPDFLNEVRLSMDPSYRYFRGHA